MFDLASLKGSGPNVWRIVKLDIEAEHGAGHRAAWPASCAPDVAQTPSALVAPPPGHLDRRRCDNRTEYAVAAQQQYAQGDCTNGCTESKAVRCRISTSRRCRWSSTSCLKLRKDLNAECGNAGRQGRQARCVQTVGQRSGHQSGGAGAQAHPPRAESERECGRTRTHFALLYDDVDISVRGGDPTDGLITPIIRNADQKGLAVQISATR